MTMSPLTPSTKPVPGYKTSPGSKAVSRIFSVTLADRGKGSLFFFIFDEFDRRHQPFAADVSHIISPAF